MTKLLLVDDNEGYLRSLRNALHAEFDVVAVPSFAQAREQTDASIGIALVDICLSEADPRNRDGLLLLEWMRMNHPHVPVVVMSAYREFDVAVDAMNLGAVYFLRKPIKLVELRALLRVLSAGGAPDTVSQRQRQE